jgi:chemotaxis signal transduction protein
MGATLLKEEIEQTDDLFKIKEEDSEAVPTDKVQLLNEALGELLIQFGQIESDKKSISNLKTRKAINTCRKLISEAQEVALSLNILSLEEIVNAAMESISSDSLKSVLQTNIQIETSRAEFEVDNLEGYRASLFPVFEYCGEALHLDRAEAIQIRAFEKESHNLIQITIEGESDTGSNHKEGAFSLSANETLLASLQVSCEASGGKPTLSKIENSDGIEINLEFPRSSKVHEGAVLKINGETVMVPMNQVVESVPVSSSDLKIISKKSQVILLRGESVPVFFGEELLFQVTADRSFGKGKTALVINSGNRGKYAVLVDEVQGHHRFSIKDMCQELEGYKGLLGAVVLRGGQPSLVVDFEQFIYRYEASRSLEVKNER